MGKWEATSLPVSFQWKISGLLQKSHNCRGQAVCKGHHGVLHPATLLSADWNEGSRTWPWAANSRENPKTESPANGLQYETVGQWWASQTGPQVYPRQNIQWTQVGDCGLSVSFARDCYKPRISLKSYSCFHNSRQFYILLHNTCVPF